MLNFEVQMRFTTVEMERRKLNTRRESTGHRLTENTAFIKYKEIKH